MSFNFFQPAKPEEARSFLESVQPIAPPIHRQIIDTAKSVARAVSHTATTTLTSPFSVGKALFYAVANICAVPSVVFNKVASIMDKTQARAHNLFIKNHKIAQKDHNASSGGHGGGH